MAASDAAVNASNYYFEYSTDGGSTWLKLGELTNCSLLRGMEVRDTTDNYSGGNREIREGKKQWSFSGEGNVAYAAEAGFAKPNDLDDLLDDRTKADWRLTTGNTGDYQYSGEGYVSSFEISGGTEENQTYSIEIQGNGALANAAVS